MVERKNHQDSKEHGGQPYVPQNVLIQTYVVFHAMMHIIECQGLFFKNINIFVAVKTTSNM